MSFHRAVWRLVARIPPGQVATYGQIARLLGRPRGARAVGQAMAALDGSMAEAVPWHRVVNARGGISPRARVSGMLTQRLRLEDEGVRVRGGRVNLARHGWPGPGNRRPGRRAAREER